MFAKLPFEYGILVFINVVGFISSYILHRKTKLISTLFILLGFLLAIVPGTFFLLANTFNIHSDFLKALTIMSSASGPIIIIGFFIFTLKFNNR